MPDPGYDVFISYSRSGQSELAASVQKGLSRLAEPWDRRRALRVFRDRTSLPASAALGSTLESALARSRVCVLLASPQAARSEWVGHEIGWWLEHRSLESLLIVLCDGALPDALPPVL